MIITFNEVAEVHKAVKIVIHTLFLYVLFLIGNFIQQSFDLSVPGSIIGMGLLFALLMLKGIKPGWIGEGSSFYVRHLTLFLIPSTVGIVNYLDIFAGRGLLLICIVVFSSAMVMVVSGLTAKKLSRGKELQHD